MGLAGCGMALCTSPLLVALLLAPVAGGGVPEWCDVVWDTPSRDHHGSMPLGNGSTCANAWINPAGELEFYLSRGDSWGDNARLLKLGKLRIALDPPPPLAPFEQVLSLADATIKVRFGSGERAVDLRLWIDANHPVVHATIEAGVPVAATATIEPWRTARSELPAIECSDVMLDRSRPNDMHGPTVVEPDTVLTGQRDRIGWYHRNIKSVGPREHAEVQDMSGFERPDPLLHRTFGAVVTAAGGRRLDDRRLQSPTGRSHRFSICVDTLHPATAEQWLARIDDHLRRVEALDFAARRRAHEEWWAERWNRSWIDARTTTGAAAGRRIPSNRHPLRIATDQAGGNRLAAELGRLSVLGRALAPAEVAALARRPHDQPPGPQPETLHCAPAPGAGPVAGSEGWALDGGVTIEAWIKPAAAGAGGGRIADKVTPGGADGILLDCHGGLRLIVGRETLQGDRRLPAGEWAHVAAVVPAAGRLRLFLDGVPVAEGGDFEPDDARVITRAYALQRFLNTCAGRGAYPIKFNGSLFTVPAEGAPGDADYRRWGPGYWWQNTRLPYTGMCASGDTDLMEPLFAQYIDRFLPLNLYRTRRYFNHGGAYYIECVQFWGDVFNETYGWAPAAGRADKLQQSGYHKWEWVAGPELVYMALDYHEHTGDDAFLRRRVLPLADAVLRFFDEHYQVDAGGRLVMHPSQALETWWDTTGPMPELAGLTAVTRRLLALPEGLASADERAFWRGFLAKLPPLPTRAVEGGAAFAPAARFAAKRNIENPELYCVFPFRLASFNRANAALAERALDQRWDRGNAGWRQDDIFMAFLGRTDQAREALAGRARNHDPNSRFPAFWGPNYDWVPDQDHGGVLMKAFQAMLMQAEPRAGDEHDGKIHLLPAWPRDWEADFRLHAPGQTVVEGRYRGGTIEALRVTPAERLADVVLPPDVRLAR